LASSTWTERSGLPQRVTFHAASKKPSPEAAAAGYNQPKVTTSKAQHEVVAAGGGVAKIEGQAGSLAYSIEQQQEKQDK